MRNPIAMFFDPRGRLQRLSYLFVVAVLFVVFVAAFMAHHFEDEQRVLAIALIGSLFYSLGCAVVKRMRDCGQQFWRLVLLLIHGFGLLYVFLLWIPATLNFEKN